MNKVIHILLIVLGLSSAIAMAANSNWTATYQVEDNITITHTPNSTCVAGMFGSGSICGGKGVHLNNLHLETDSSQAEFEQAIRDAGYHPVQIG